MTPPTTTERRRPRTSMSRLVLSTTVTLMLTRTPASGFQSVSGLSASPTAYADVATRRFFRNNAEAFATTDILLPQPEEATSTAYPISSYSGWTEHASYHESLGWTEPSSSSSPSLPEPQPVDHNYLPTWLADSKDPLWESAWYQLQDAMLRSSFSPQETQRLLHALQTAARGDRHQMASAAEFCLLLVEHMEMGLTALQAAAYHVCACLTARQQGEYGVTHSTSFYYDHAFDDAHAASGAISAEDHHVSLIAKDAGRLKTLEMVAAMIYSDKAASRVTPDAQDAENLRSLLLTETKDWRALAIRAAAALYRLRGILTHHQKTATGVGGREIPHISREALQCSREALYIYAPLASRMGMHRLKNELEGAAFRILYRRQYERVNRLARELRPVHSKPHLNRGLVEMSCDHTLDISSCMKNVLETVKADMTQLLANDPHFSEHVQDFSVTARVKEPYSLWKKMLRNKCSAIRQVPDAIALRVVLEAKKSSEGEDESVVQARERALCYYAQSLCMEHWQPVGRFKDYISDPKANGYQSLHYTAHTLWDQEDWNLEIQVRSLEMHQVAEFGLASHWDYKQQQQQRQQFQQEQHIPFVAVNDDQSSDAYLRSVQEWHWQQQTPGQHGREWIDTSTDSEERANRIRARTKTLQPYIEALTAAQSDLARNSVFVFLTTRKTVDPNSNLAQQGSVLALPAGACVLDALREGEKEWGTPLAFGCDKQMSLNGELLTKVTGKLQNGDILTVPPTVAAPTTQQQEHFQF